MGALNIRTASAGVNRLGTPRMPIVDTGAAEAMSAHARAAAAAADAIGRVGRAQIEGMSRRSQIAADALIRLGGKVVDFVKDMRDREDERLATEAVLGSENDRNLYMTGDGTPEHPGQFNVRQGKDGKWHAKEWLDDIKSAAEARREKYTKDLNGRQRRIYDEMVAKHDVAWNARIFAHAAKTTMDEEVTTAANALLQAKNKAIRDFDVLEARDGSIADMYEAKRKEMDARQVPEGLRAAEYKALTEDYLVNLARTKFTAWQNETFDSTDAADVADKWKAKAKEFEQVGGRVITNELIRKHLGSDTLDKTRQEMLTKEFNTHKAAAVGRAYSLEREAERKELGEIELKSREAIASGDPGQIETALRDMQDRVEKLGGDEKTKGSRVHVAALEEAKRLDKAADSLAQYQLMDDLVNGEKLMREDGKTPTFEGDPRKERLFPKVYAAFQDQKRKEFNKAFRSAHDRELMNADAAMMKAVANNSPQGFYEYLTDAVVNRKITTGDFIRLRDKFNDGWMKGFKGAPGQQSKQSAMAQDMLAAIKDKLGVDMSVAIKTDDSGDPAIRNGAIDWDDKALEKGDVELPDASVRRQFRKPARHGDMFFSFGSDTGTRKEIIEGQQLRKALNMALSLWSSDGMQIEIDPVTGERLKDGKTHTVNAVEDFRALLDRLADEKNVLSAAETLKQQSAYAVNIGLYATAAENRRTRKQTGAETVSDEQVGKKDDKDE